MSDFSASVTFVTKEKRNATKEYWFDPAYYGCFHMVDPFARLFAAKDIDGVYDALASAFAQSDEGAAELARIIRTNIQVEDIDQIETLKVWFGYDIDDARESSGMSFAMGRYRFWHDVAELCITNWGDQSEEVHAKAHACLGQAGGLGQALSDCLSQAVSDVDGVVTVSVPVEGTEGMWGMLNTVDLLSSAAPELEVQGTVGLVGFNDDGDAISEVEMTLWSIAGLAGVGYKVVEVSHGDNFRWRQADEYTVVSSSSPQGERQIGVTSSMLESANDLSACAGLPAVLDTAGRRMRKGVVLQEGDPLLLEVNVDGREREFPRVDPNKKRNPLDPKVVDPFEVKVKTLKGKGQGSLVVDHQTARMLTLNVGRAVAFVESVEPLRVYVDIAPGSKPLTAKALGDVAFKFVKRNAKKSSKSFKSFGGYVRKYPDRKLA